MSSPPRRAADRSRAKTARDIAYDVLTRWQTGPARAVPLLDEALRTETLAPAERGLATELVHGVMRRCETLSLLVQPHVKRPLAQVESGALVLLWLGAYQRIMLSGIPEYAVVNETTELARRLGKPQWTGFINAVLRSLGRSVTDAPASAPAADAVPLTQGKYRQVAAPVFPDPRRDPVAYFAAAFSFPRWLADRWSGRLPREALWELGFWFNSPSGLCLRVNTLRTSRDEFLAALQQAGIPARAGTRPEAVLLDGYPGVTGLPGFDAGWFAVQDESAIAAGALLDPQPGERVLDLCAAPGGKTTHLAALMQNQGRIVACDVDSTRLTRVDESCRRLGVTIVETRRVERDSIDLGEERFDRILLDVPCTNTGVLGKRPEARWRLRVADLIELPAIQKRLLETACRLLVPGGRIVYSTCSMEPEENRGVVDHVLEVQPGLRLVAEQVHYPGQPADGGYQALLQAGSATA